MYFVHNCPGLFLGLLFQYFSSMGEENLENAFNSFSFACVNGKIWKVDIIFSK